MATLRGRLERMREEIRTRELQLDEQRARQDARETLLAAKEQELDKLQTALQSDQDLYARDRQQWLERGAIMDAPCAR